MIFTRNKDSEFTWKISRQKQRGRAGSYVATSLIEEPWCLPINATTESAAGTYQDYDKEIIAQLARLSQMMGGKIAKIS
jgi:hypothetical protein